MQGDLACFSSSVMTLSKQLLILNEQSGTFLNSWMALIFLDVIASERMSNKDVDAQVSRLWNFYRVL